METSILTKGNKALDNRHKINIGNKEIASEILLKEGEIALAVDDVATSSAGAAGAASGMLSPLGMNVIAATALAAAAFMVYKQFAKVSDELGTAAFAPGWAEAFLNPDAAVAFAKEFGVVAELSADTSIHMRLLERRFGIAAESAVKLVKAMGNVSSSTTETLLAQIDANAMLARAEGLAPKQVLADVAANTELFAKFAKDGGNNIFEAARQASKLGISLSDVGSAAESLLDFETSIEKQMEAEILLGRGLNLEKARQLSYVGDMTGLQKELLRLAGSEAEWNELDLIKRKAMAEALGLGLEQITSMIGAQERLNQIANQSPFEKFGGWMKSAVVGASALLPILLGVAAATYSILPGLVSMIPFFGQALAAGMWRKVAIQTAKTAGAAAVGFAAGTALQKGLEFTLAGQSPGFQDLEEGKKVDIQRGEARAHAGETITHTDELSKLNEDAEAWRGFKLQQPSPTDTSKMEALLGEVVTSNKGILAENKKVVTENKVLREQNLFLFGKLGRTIEGQKLA